MRDFARSDNSEVQAQLDRLEALSVPQGRLGLDTIRALLGRLGNPHLRLPPAFHVAGTNGKGSTCAFLRAMMEADGYTVHATTSPHLVRYNERIRVAGELISDERLAFVLKQVLDVGEDLSPSFFEVTIAAAFTEFARVPADACVVEVGLGGRFDATNVIENPVACGIAALGIDHERFLLAPEDGTPTEPLARIAFEKMGIAKRGAPLCALAPKAPAIEIMHLIAERQGAKLHLEGRDWQIHPRKDGFEFSDAAGAIYLPSPAMPGDHQMSNAALAVAMLRCQDRVPVSERAMARGIEAALWPARLHLLAEGPVTRGRRVWLDGGHNASAGEMLARHFKRQRLHLVIGMLEAKDPQSLIGPLAASIESVTVVPVPGHDWHPSEKFGDGARSAPDVIEAIASLPDDRLPVLVAGSLYLAGTVLAANGELPD